MIRGLPSSSHWRFCWPPPTVAAPAGEILDRIVATVNGHIILQSDWEDAVRYEAFIADRPADQLPPRTAKPHSTA